MLAQVGNERINETADLELGIDQVLETYLKKGYSNAWINQRLQSIRNALMLLVVINAKICRIKSMVVILRR